MLHNQNPWKEEKTLFRNKTKNTIIDNDLIYSILSAAPSCTWILRHYVPFMIKCFSKSCHPKHFDILDEIAEFILKEYHLLIL